MKKNLSGLSNRIGSGHYYCIDTIINKDKTTSNGCAFCLDMHSKDMLAAGESDQRLFVLDAWREAPFYSDRERAALAWAESLTRLNNGHVDEAVYNEALKQFTEEELIDVTFAVLAINCYNRVNIAFPNPAVVGTYKPGMFATN
jgi:alkylhydroperoxidase family enzyme